MVDDLISHQNISKSHKSHGFCWLMTIYGYGSIPIHTIFRGWTSINPSYFDVHQGYQVLTHCHISPFSHDFHLLKWPYLPHNPHLQGARDRWPCCRRAGHLRAVRLSRWWLGDGDPTGARWIPESPENVMAIFGHRGSFRNGMGGPYFGTKSCFFWRKIDTCFLEPDNFWCGCIIQLKIQWGFHETVSGQIQS